MPFTSEAAKKYGDTKARLRAPGTMIGELDCLIAAQALALGLPIVTNNVSEFKRIPKLKVQNWVKSP